MDYEEFCESKLVCEAPVGIESPAELSPHLFPEQRDLTTVALKRGRCGLFIPTGSGKTQCEIEFARVVSEHTGKPVLILAPLAVAKQHVREGAKFGYDVKRVFDQSEVNGPGVYVTNYDRIHLFDADAFGGVVLDEGSAIKDNNSARRNLLTEMFSRTPFRLSATATPAPNDWLELGTQAEFLGVRTREEMMAEFFVHDGGNTQEWMLKRHGENKFWEWVASWALVIRRPSDLGYDDSDRQLPPLNIHEIIIGLGSDYAHRAGTLFVESAKTLSEQREVRRLTIPERVQACANLVAREPDEAWVIWGELNEECDALEAAIPGAIQVSGSNTTEIKEQRLEDFTDGRIKVLVSKAKIAGHGLNWQHAARMVFVGASYSYEQVFQATRRIWRWGQKRPVEVYFIATDADRAILDALKRKERDAERLADEASKYMIELTRAAVTATKNDREDYVASVDMRVPSWLVSEAA